MTSPSNATFVLLINDASTGANTPPPGWVLLSFTPTDAAVGLPAAAYYNKSTNQVVTVLSGVSTSSGSSGSTGIVNPMADTADSQLMAGQTPTQYDNAVLAYGPRWCIDRPQVVLRGYVLTASGRSGGLCRWQG